MSNKRKKLVEQIQLLNEQVNELRSQIHEIDYTKDLKEKTKFVGKFFKQVSRHRSDDNYNRMQYCLSLDKESLGYEVLDIHWYKNLETYYSIEYSTTLWVSKEEYKKEWVEITKEEFMAGYAYVKTLLPAL